MSAKVQHKRPMRRALLMPLLGVAALICLLPLATLLVSGATLQMEKDAVALNDNAVQARSSSLHSTMTGHWASIGDNAWYYEARLAAQLAADGATVDTFMNDSDAQQAYIASVFDELLDDMNTANVGGIFMVMASGHADDNAQHEGFYVRDTNPDGSSYTNDDLLLERGDESLGASSGVGRDDTWASTFTLGASGERAADDFFYQPLQAGVADADAATAELGYWSEPFVLEGNAQDHHRMITYSVPLRVNGRVFAVLGIEVSCSYLARSYLGYGDLSGEGSAYVLAYKNADGAYTYLLGKGGLASSVGSAGSGFVLKNSEHSGAQQIKDKTTEGQGILAFVSELDLYGVDSPYDSTDWVLVGCADEEAVVGTCHKVIADVVLAAVAAAVLGLIVMTLTVREVSRPFSALVENVRGGIDGLFAFEPSGISEVDELHEVVEDLTLREMATSAGLSEEKERYLQAIEASEDIFFAYRPATQTLEIVNSEGDDGVYVGQESIRQLTGRVFPVGVMYALSGMDIAHGGDSVVEVRGSIPGFTPDGWIEVNARVVERTRDGGAMVAGYLRDITKRKEHELAEAYREVRDPVSGLYRLEPGLQVIDERRAAVPCGTMLLFDLCDFVKVVSRLGLTFGDVIIDELAHILHESFAAAPAVLVRAGGDEFLVWTEETDEDACRAAVARARESYSALVRSEALELGFTVGAVSAGSDLDAAELARRAAVALREAKACGKNLVTWRDVRDPLLDAKPFGQIMSTTNVAQMSLSTLALNLLDRRFSLTAALDLLSWRLQKRYGVQNLMVTSFSQENLTVTMMYRRRHVAKFSSRDTVLRCSAEDARRLQEAAGHGGLMAIGDFSPIGGYKAWSAGVVPDGISFFMTNNGRYSGSIIMTGVDSAAVLANEDDAGALWEVCSIVRNRINRERLDHSAQAKSDFLARMSHEIRTPMNGIIGMTEIALEPGQTEERRIDCLQKVRGSSHYLLGLLNDILDMSKIESGKMGLVTSEFDLPKLLDDLRGVVGARFDEKRQTLVSDIQLGHRYYIGDALRINQVLINLLGNANKYSGEGTQVELTVHERELEHGACAVAFAVKDHGMGISHDDALRIFDKFEQVGTTDARQQGTGLGLAISSNLVRMMGGVIELESELGQGSTFSFTIELPVAEHAGNEDGEEAKTAPAPEPAVANLDGLHVLVAEDNALNMEIICYMLEEHGCIVDGVGDGRACVDAFAASEPGFYGLVIMDVMMPVMDGLEAARAIRALDRADAGTVPIVAASANAFEEDVKRSLAAGMNAHVSKPIEISALLAALSSVL